MDIKGYRALTDQDITTINSIKDAEIWVGELWREVTQGTACDARWAAIARTHLEEGFSALVRSIAQPEDRF